jgi:hypothetical protein
MPRLPIIALEQIANSNINFVDHRNRASKIQAPSKLQVFEGKSYTVIGPKGPGILDMGMEPLVYGRDGQCIGFYTEGIGIIRYLISGEDRDIIIHQRAETLPLRNGYIEIDFDLVLDRQMEIIMER